MSIFDISIAQRDLNTAYIGRRIVHKPVTVTTMDDAEDGARRGDPNGTVYIADVMTGGRGTKGRSWVAKSDENLYMSFVLHIQLPQEENPTTNRCREFDLDVAGAISSLLALGEIGIKEIKVKWLNDLWIRGHKILGALTEYKGKVTVESLERHLYILGIGLNINCDMRRDPAMQHLSTSVMCELGHKVSRELLFAKICNHLEPFLKMDRQDLLKLYICHEAIQYGDVVQACLFSGREENYTFNKVKDDWSVDLKGENGESVCFSCTEISLRPLRTKVIYVLTGPDIQSWSSDCLLRTCNSLVNSQKYNVKSLSTDKISLDKLSSCSLIIIGQVKSISAFKSKFIGLINCYVQNGGSCLAIGNACFLFEPDDCPQDQCQENIPSVIKSSFCGYTSPEQQVNLYIFQENDQPCYEHYSSPHVLSRRYSDTKYDNKETENDIIFSNADVAICDVGKGKICFCKPNIEICYADIDDYFQSFGNNKAVLAETVHQRDCLFLLILAQLLK